MRRFILMCGLPASGKSTVVNELAEGRENISIHSSDELRTELFGDINNQNNNAQLFNELHKRIFIDLKNGKDVIMDATNINRKKRKGLLQQLPKDVEKIVIYVATDYKNIIERNNNRERVVPQHVIDKMYKNMQIPIYSEGWDKIIFEYDDDTLENDLPKQFTDYVRAGVMFNREGYELMGFLAQYFDEFFKIYDLSQDSKWHNFSVSRHTYYVYQHILDNYEDEDKELMLWTALLHDTGKAFCKTFTSRTGEPMRYAQFISHEHVGSQLAVNFLKRMNFEDGFIHKVSTLIQFHMYLLDENANKQKLLERVGEDMYKKLECLREADTLAH